MHGCTCWGVDSHLFCVLSSHTSASYWPRTPPLFSRRGYWGLKRNKVKQLTRKARTRTQVSSLCVFGQKPHTDNNLTCDLLGVSLCCLLVPSSLSHWVFPAAWLPRRHRAVQRAGAGLRPLAVSLLFTVFHQTGTRTIAKVFSVTRFWTENETSSSLATLVFLPFSSFPYETSLFLSFAFLFSMVVIICRPWQYIA